MSRFLCAVASTLTAAMIFQSLTALADPSNPIYLYASQTGRRTLDRGEGGGNPFASALVELLDRETLSFDAFRIQLVELTQRKSRGLQLPEVQAPVELGEWQLLPKPQAETWVALVLVYSDYSTGGAKSLPGAKHDMRRVADALARAGFQVQTLLDPPRGSLDIALAKFADRSGTADVAALYTTGHGMEFQSAIYLLPGDYPITQRTDSLKERAVRITVLGSALRARRANPLFYGGCRNNPFGMP